MGVWDYFIKVFFASIKSPITITGLFLAFIPVIREIIIRFRPQYEDAMKAYLYITIPLTLLFGLFIISLLLSGYNIYKQDNNQGQQTIKELTTDLKAARESAIPSVHQIMLLPYFKNIDIPIAGISTTLPEPVLKNKTFENCRIIGPVIFVLQNNVTITHCSFEGDLESMFIVTTNKKVWGAVALDHDTFIGCDFKKVAFIGPQELIDKIKKGFSQ